MILFFYYFQLYIDLQIMESYYFISRKTQNTLENDICTSHHYKYIVHFIMTKHTSLYTTLHYKHTNDILSTVHIDILSTLYDYISTLHNDISTLYTT